MPRFFVPEVSGDHILVTGGDARHISYSLRMATGDDITFCNSGKDYFCKIESFSEEGVLCKIISSENSKSEPDVFLTLYQALPKGDKFETIIQKSIELGASRIVPVMTKRCVSRPDDKSFAKKLTRYNKIAEEAAKQSGRGIIPEITPIMDFDKAIKEASENDLPLICYEREGGKRRRKDQRRNKTQKRPKGINAEKLCFPKQSFLFSIFVFECAVFLFQLLVFKAKPLVFLFECACQPIV